MKRVYVYLVLSVVFTLLGSGCDKDPTAVLDNGNDITIVITNTVGSTVEIKTPIQMSTCPDGLNRLPVGLKENIAVTWRSSNEAVAKVEFENGKPYIRAVGPGTADIFATAGNSSDFITVIVTGCLPASTITGVTINVNPTSVGVCPSTVTITPTVQGTGNYNQAANLTASSGTVTQSGTNTWTWQATQSGTVTFTANAVGNSQKTVQYVLSVNCAPPPPPQRVFTRIDYSPNGGTLAVNQSVQAVPTCFDQYDQVMPCPALTWVSTAPSRIEVSSTGLITCRFAGAREEISVRAVPGGPSRPYAWNCSGPTGQLEANPSVITRTNCPGFNNAGTATATQGGQLVSMTWTSSNPSIVTVNSLTGAYTLTGNAGSTTLVGQATGGGTVTIPVTVNQCPPSGQPVASPSSVTLNNCPGFQPNWTISITGGTVTSGSWLSSATGVATVNQNGVVTITGMAGSASITVQTNNGQVTIPVTVTACPQNPSITVTGPTTFSCIAGQTFSVPLTVTASGGASTAGTFTLVSSTPTGAATTLVNFTQQGNAVSGNCLGSGTVVIRWTSTQFPSVQHNITGTVTAGNVTCVFRVNGQVVTSMTIAVGQTGMPQLECTNQFGVQFLPFWHSSAPNRVEAQGLQSIQRANATWWVGFSAQLRRHQTGAVNITAQVEVTNPTPLATLVVN